MRMFLAATLCGALAGPAAAGEARVVVPVPDAERGRELFVSKGCFVCHAVNGVGGGAGPGLDAGSRPEAIDPLDFAARMWRGALAMAELQSLEFGYQIEVSGPEIADLAAFAADPEVQATFSEAMIPEIVRGWIIEEPFAPTPLDEE